MALAVQGRESSLLSATNLGRLYPRRTLDSAVRGTGARGLPALRPLRDVGETARRPRDRRVSEAPDPTAAELSGHRRTGSAGLGFAGFRCPSSAAELTENFWHIADHDPRSRAVPTRRRQTFPAVARGT